MTDQQTITGFFTEGAPVELEASWPNGTVLWQQSDFTNIVALSIFDKSLSNSSTAVATPSRVKTAVLTNTPGSWTLSDTGPNFTDTITSAELATEGGHTYRFEYGFTRADGNGIEYLVFQGRSRYVDSV